MTEISSLKIQGRDDDNELIMTIYHRGPTYLIYGTNQTRVKWLAKEATLAQNFKLLDAKAIKIYGVAAGNKSLQKILFENHANALGLCAMQKIDEANLLLADIETRILRLRNQYGKIYYLSSCFIVVLITAAITAFLKVQGSANDILFLASIISCGALGAFLSIMLNLKKISIDNDASWSLAFVSGASRVFIGIVGAIFTFLLIKADIVLGFVINTNSDFAILAICMVAGFSETLVPNILKKIEKQK